ncbi:LexA family protein [Paenibacillus piscarius]|uniref:LexA family protein n=1 Tax=Paenibacillus piscarius TaxID=1089681 RepID=UPI001EE81EA0|nr:XRE family transcriptional regulator [Paenibacillus piscarius]
MYKSQRQIFADNLVKLLDSKKIDQRDLAEKIGVSTQAVSSWATGIKYPRIDKIQKIADYLNVPKSALMDDVPTNLIPYSPQTVPVPILGVIACGDPILADENIQGYRYESPDSLPAGNVFYLEAKGDSMSPTIPSKSLVLVREQPEVEYGEIAAVLVNGDTEATLKRVKKQGDIVMLMPDNPDHEPIIITKDNPARIIGKAIRYTQEL